MNDEQLVRAIGVARVVAGVALLAAPKQAASGWVGAVAADERSHPLTRGFGARELALGVLVCTAPNPTLLRLAAVCDAADGIGTVLARRSLSKPVVFGLAAGTLGSAAIHLVRAQRS